MVMVKVFRYIGEHGDGLLFIPVELKSTEDEDFKFICEMNVPRSLLNELTFDNQIGGYCAFYIE